MLDSPIIIKRNKKAYHTSHGGAWKIAYADFITAMMALFLIMWLINVSTEETKKGISDYFTTSLISMKDSSAGAGVMKGENSEKQNSNSDQEENDTDNKHNSYHSLSSTEKNQQTPKMQILLNDFAVSQMENKEEDHRGILSANENNQQRIESHIKQQKAISADANAVNLKKIDNVGNKEQKKSAETIVESKEESEKIVVKMQEQKEARQKIEKNIKVAFNSLQEVEKFKHNLMIELTDEGIRIQIVDSSDHEMFKSGSPNPVKFTEKIISALGEVISKLPNKIDITGHTDSLPFHGKDYGNWELSSDRAHSTRRILEKSGVKGDRFVEVNGRADKDPINRSNTKAPENRRVSITILYAKHKSEGVEDTQNQKNSNKKTPKIIL